MNHSLALVLALAATVVPVSGLAEEGRVTMVSRAPSSRVAPALEQAIPEQKMTLICHANAQRGAVARGVSIKGNQVLMVFRNDFAIRLLPADPAAGFEAPLRIYVYETPDGTATITCRTPSAVFAPYTHPEVRAVAEELDPILKTIVNRARGRTRGDGKRYRGAPSRTGRSHNSKRARATTSR